jgi:protein gp37
VSTRAIWCHLFDPVTGEPYNRTKPTMVYVSSNAVLYDLQEAVKAKFSDIFIENMLPTVLHIYNTKAAFDKRNDTKAKTHPLTPNCFLSKPDLGTSMENALVVAVTTKERQAVGVEAYHVAVDVETYCQQILDDIAVRLGHFLFETAK